MNRLKRKICFILVAVFAISLFPRPTLSVFNLVKTADSSTVYYLDELGYRHAFPNEITFRSWYGENFSKILTVSRGFLTDYPLGKNITIRSGKYLVKVPTDPKVYAVEPGGLLRHIENPEIAQSIYGEDWEEKIVDLPEVFFENYTLGKPIKHTWDIPEGVVYQIEGEDKIYWKENEIIRPFASIEALEKNGYTLDDVIVFSKVYYTRSKPIIGFDKQVFDPIEAPYRDSRDCENKNLKVAFLFINKGSFTLEEVEKINTIKKNLRTSFSWATDGLSQINVDYPTSSFKDDGYLIRQEEGRDVLAKDEIAQAFYANNTDVFDFLILFTNFPVLVTEIADFLPVSNKVSGLGKVLLDSSAVYGSFGKLKGIINMGNINKYDTETTAGLNQAENYLMHEILHNWSGAVKFIDDQGKKNTSLLREPDLVHWSYYAGFVSPLGGSGWQDNGDGTFTSLTSQMTDSSKKKFADIDLYLMGLIPAREMEPIMYLVPKEKGALGNTIEATSKYVTINQIIAAEGEWRCSNN